MPLADAEKFIKRVVSDNEFRDSIYVFDNFNDRMQFIAESGYPFAYEEFGESIIHLKTESPTEENAQLLDEIFTWWQFINLDREEPGGGNGLCTSSCGGSCCPSH